MDTRTCKLCSEVKPLSEYHKNGSGGHRRQCKQCINSGAAKAASKPRPKHDPENGKKACSVCGKLKSFNQFRPHKKGAFGRIANCRTCENAANTEWRKQNKDYYKTYRDENLDRMREAERKRHYKYAGYQEGMYEALMELQNHTCRICGEVDTDRGLCVDHCHTEDRIRGLLCKRCNLGIGSFQDDLDLLRSAMKYLQEADAATDLDA